MEEYIAPNRKRIPYGMMNFAVIRRDDCYYVDKTRFIPIIEDADKFFFFIRPRRFGKSLTVSMLQHYYDIAAKDKFDALFGDLLTTFAISMPTIFLRVLKKNWMQKKEP